LERRPKFDLERLVEAASVDAFMLGGSRCLVILLQYLPDHLTCRRFVQELVALLSQGDFCNTKMLEDRKGDAEDFDEYGIEASTELLDQYGMEEVCWYIKFTIRKGDWGDEVFFISVHPLEKPIERVDGWLSPKRRLHS